MPMVLGRVWRLWSSDTVRIRISMTTVFASISIALILQTATVVFMHSKMSRQMETLHTYHRSQTARTRVQHVQVPSLFRPSHPGTRLHRLKPVVSLGRGWITPRPLPRQSILFLGCGCITRLRPRTSMPLPSFASSLPVLLPSSLPLLTAMPCLAPQEIKVLQDKAEHHRVQGEVAIQAASNIQAFKEAIRSSMVAATVAQRLNETWNPTQHTNPAFDLGYMPDTYSQGTGGCAETERRLLTLQKQCDDVKLDLSAAKARELKMTERRSDKGRYEAAQLPPYAPQTSALNPEPRQGSLRGQLPVRMPRSITVASLLC